MNQSQSYTPVVNLMEAESRVVVARKRGDSGLWFIGYGVSETKWEGFRDLLEANTVHLMLLHCKVQSG